MLSDIIQFAADNPFLSIGAFSVCYWVLLSYFTGDTHKLKHIPTVGYEAPFLSFFSAIAFILKAQKVVTSGIKRWPKSGFKVSGVNEWLLVTANPKSIEELRKAPEHVLSFHLAVDESLQVKYTLGENISTNPYHIPIIRAQLTRSLPLLVPEVIDEVQQAFKDVIPPCDEWVGVKVLENTMKIVSRASNRIFVGLPLCRNPEYLQLNIEFTVEVIKTGAILRMIPSGPLRTFVNYLISNVPKRVEVGLKHLGPVIQARKKERSEKGAAASQPVDVLTWLMDEANEEEMTDKNLTIRMLTINFAAIHTSSMAFSHVVFHLATYPKYIEPLREEVEEAVSEQGWSKESLDSMVKIDSFIKEVQRLCPLGVLNMQRVAVSDFQFDDGTFVPRGTTVSVAVEAAHLNGAVYDEPEDFRPFRFVEMKEKNARKKYDIVSTSCDSLPFGHGVHACPGRYFAACELKLMLAHLVLHYDVELENGGVRPADMWAATSRVPNPTAKVMFRKRRA